MTHQEKQKAFDDAVDAKVAGGLTVGAALAEIEAENPELFYGESRPPGRPSFQPAGNRHELRRDWQSRVNAYIASGKTPGVAARLVEEESPGLHQRMLDAHNPRATPAPTFASGDCGSFQSLQREWREAITTRVAGGMRAYEAVSHAAKECGTLRDRLVVAGNKHDRLVRQGKCTCNKNV